MTVRKVDDNPENRDPISGEHGAHPVGVGVGAAVGGAATGAAVGTAAGPVGTAVGAAVGGVIGGLAGKAIAEDVNPTVENAYWRENYRTRPYVDAGSEYDVYEPAYRYGWESRPSHSGKTFDQAESDLSAGWAKFRGKSTLEWEKAKHATRDAWERIECHRCP